MRSIKNHPDYAFRENDYVLFIGESGQQFYGYVLGYTRNGLVRVKPFDHPNERHIHRSKITLVNNIYLK